MWRTVLQDEEFRHDARFQIDNYAAAEHPLLGHLILRIVNLSSTGAMVDGKAGIERGDRLILRLPGTKGVEALCLWTRHQLAGLQFDQPIRLTDFATTVDVMNSHRIAFPQTRSVR